jgi:hypothetical protein
LVAAGASILGFTTTEVDLYMIRDDATQTATCADNATPALASTVTITPTQGYIAYTNSDADGCAITLSETGAADGRTFEIVTVSNAGGVNTLADSAGVQETGAGCSMTVWGSAQFRYATDRFIMTSCQAVN